MISEHTLSIEVYHELYIIKSNLKKALYRVYFKRLVLNNFFYFSLQFKIIYTLNQGTLYV